MTSLQSASKEPVVGLALTATPELIDALAAEPRVARIEYDALVQLPEVTPSQLIDAEWNIEAVHAPELWERGFTGQGVTVAVLDSGVDVNHPALASRYRGGPAGWYDPYRQTTIPYDPSGHGTLVAGVILGKADSGPVIGVAPDAQWVAAKIFRDDDSAENSEILKAFQWVLDPDGNPATDDSVADVVNNSWGFEEAPGTCDSLFRPAIQNLKSAGIAVVFSAGNTGPGRGVSPANYTESFAVGAINRFSLLADFSGLGPSECDGSIFPEVVAPGDHIFTSDSGGGYSFVTGTSFSAPHVSGAMALLLSVAPSLSTAELERILKSSATDLGPVGPDNAYGFGLINVLSAFSLINGDPQISVHDSAPPFEDLRLDFGHVPPGATATQTATVRNAGEGSLQIGDIGTVQAPFALAADECSGHVLTAGQSCSISLRFTPSALATYAEIIDIPSSDPDQTVTTLQLLGEGNAPPPAPQLVFPGNGASGINVPVTLAWTQSPDANGDAITQIVQISERNDFSDSDPQQVRVSKNHSTVLISGAGGFFFFGLGAGIKRRRLLASLLLAAAVSLLFACSGGSDSPAEDSAQPLPGEIFTQTVTDLTADTTYYWKVVSTDSRGATAESEVFSFTTRP